MARKKTTLDFDTQLHVVPIANERLQVDIVEDRPHLRRVTVALKYSGLARLFKGPLKLREQRTYQLDRAGSEVLDLANGTRTLENMVDTFAERHRLTFFESRGLIVAYLSSLMERGILVVGVPDAAATPEPSVPSP